MQEWDIADLQTRLAAGELNSRRIVESYLERIEAIDRKGPGLNSIIEINPDVLEIAENLDKERAQSRVRSPLHGIPILLKDNIDTADRMNTTAGSLALEGSIPARDAFLAARLREAGAIFLGKANLSEWANFRSTHSVSGWSSRGGQTRNPYALDRSPCGSSSGSAAAVAANLCVAAIGTETDGSIVCPSQTCGIVGLKPTLGLVSRSGIIPISHSQDTSGPMARSVADVAALLGVLVGPDVDDPATPESGGRLSGDYTQFLRKDGLQGARLGVAREFAGNHPLVDQLFETCLLALKDQGAVMVDPVTFGSLTQLDESELEVLHYDFKADLTGYLSRLGPTARVHSLADVIEFNERNRERVMPYFGHEHMLKAQEKGPLLDETYRNALETARRLARAEGIDRLLQAHGLDAIVAPTGSPAWLIDYVLGDTGSGGCSSPAAVAGYPHITVPAGFIHGLPVGLSFFGPAWSEPVLIRLAYAFEQATRFRRQPTYLPSIRF